MAIGRVNTGGSGSGATLVITGVAGDTCTISKSGKTKTKTFDSSGKATFKGLDTGTWTVTMTNSSGSTATRTVTVNADYTLTIAYFGATIAVTYPEGSTCTCSDGSTTLTAADTSGSYTFTVGNTGTWTVTCTNGTDTASESVSITADGQSETVTLGYELVLWDNGSVNEDVTGGWGSLSDTVISLLGTGYGAGVAQTTNKIDLTGKDTITFRVTSASYSGSTYSLLGVGEAIASGSFVASQKINNNVSEATEYSVDISTLNGEYYVGIFTHGYFVNSGGYEGAYSSKISVDQIVLS